MFQRCSRGILLVALSSTLALADEPLPQPPDAPAEPVTEATPATPPAPAPAPEPTATATPAAATPAPETSPPPLGVADASSDDRTTKPTTVRTRGFGGGATLSMLSTRSSSTPLMHGLDGTGSGLTLRLQSGWNLGGSGFGIGPMGAFETGLGYQSFDGSYTGHMWFLLRLEFGLETTYRVSDDLVLGARGTFVAHLNSARELGSADDIWVLKALAYYQRLAVMVGTKSPFQDVPLMGGGGASNLTFGAQYQLNKDRYVGLEYARFSGTEIDSDFTSHELRLVIGLY